MRLISLKLQIIIKKFFQKVILLKLVLKRKNIKFKSGKNSYFNLLNNINDDLKKIFIVDYNDEIILVDSVGTIIKLDHSNNFQESIVRNNIKSLGPKDIKDAHILGNNLFISYSYTKEKNCDYFRVAKAKINENELNFNIFFDPQECNKNIIAGKMSNYTLNNKIGLLVTTGSDGKEDKKVAQLDESIFGKILFFDLINNNYKLISKGHRNPQGLFVFNQKILSTEHGPKGGDEINLIKINSNYGWPIASYGEPYNFKLGSKYKFKNSTLKIISLNQYILLFHQSEFHK